MSRYWCSHSNETANTRYARQWGNAATDRNAVCPGRGPWRSVRGSAGITPMKPITILRKKAKLGDQGFPRATLAFYGPDDKKATKAVLGIFLHEGAQPTIHRYFSEDKDARFNVEIQQSIVARLHEHAVNSLIMVEEIFGCPHEEGIDYPEGESCPKCPFWKGRDRFTAIE